ncbi:MAG TPA: 16S rRNA (cytosine(1402)-N(4))-methyltransferase RsmH [Actinobacteria bacterium]|nr:16S rRNA (cytosine(1402)-N(4))-methyltransferase RsmH [Actinomycetota bacterium]
MNQTPDKNAYHRPVMVDEVVDLLRPVPDGIIVDATYGGGGHSRALARQLGHPILAIDRDPDAASLSAGVRARNFRDLASLLEEEGVDEISGALFDLGVSSHQLDEPARGFSYRTHGPLDMRMGPDAATAAGEMVNEWDENDLARILRTLGEERFADRVARAIVRARPIRDTVQLADVVRDAIPAATRRTGGHPARRTFQALRIAVNEELEALESGLDAAVDSLTPGGRCVVISYHSLEDRIVKRRFLSGSQGCVCPPDLPVCGCGQSAELRILTRRPVTPREEEIAGNPRARSAKLRAAEKVAA